MTTLDMLAGPAAPIARRRVALLSLLVACLAPAACAAETRASSDQPCSASILVEADSGRIISENDAHTPLPPASMVKIMVAYVALKKVKAGVVSLDDVVTTSAFASRVGGSQVYLKEKEQFTMREMLEAILVQSANDAAVAVSEHIGGTQAGFVELMNSEARALGLQETEFNSAHGLPPGKGQKGDKVSAHDMAVIARALITEFPEVLETTGKLEAPFRNGAFIMRNHNKLLGSYANCDGLKTGYIAQAGFCVTATAKRNDFRLIAVVMGCKERKRRDAETARLLSLGFASYKAVKVADVGSPSGQAVPVVDGTLRTVVPVAQKPFSVVVKLGDEQRIVKKVTACRHLYAPVEKGTPCGDMIFMVDGKEAGRVELVVPENIPPLGFGRRLLRKIGL